MATLGFRSALTFAESREELNLFDAFDCSQCILHPAVGPILQHQRVKHSSHTNETENGLFFPHCLGLIRQNVLFTVRRNSFVLFSVGNRYARCLCSPLVPRIFAEVLLAHEVEELNSDTGFTPNVN